MSYFGSKSCITHCNTYLPKFSYQKFSLKRWSRKIILKKLTHNKLYIVGKVWLWGVQICMSFCCRVKFCFHGNLFLEVLFSNRFRHIWLCNSLWLPHIPFLVVFFDSSDNSLSEYVYFYRYKMSNVRRIFDWIKTVQFLGKLGL